MWSTGHDSGTAPREDHKNNIAHKMHKALACRPDVDARGGQEQQKKEDEVSAITSRISGSACSSTRVYSYKLFHRLAFGRRRLARAASGTSYTDLGGERESCAAEFAALRATACGTHKKKTANARSGLHRWCSARGFPPQTLPVCGSRREAYIKLAWRAIGIAEFFARSLAKSLVAFLPVKAASHCWLKAARLRMPLDANPARRGEEAKLRKAVAPIIFPRFKNSTK